MAKKTYEDSVKRLEDIVSALECGDASLDESLKLFEEGTKLVHDCGAMLDKAEQKVARLPEEPVFNISTSLSATSISTKPRRR